MTKDNIFKNIKVLIFDVDGVFTDTRFLVNEDGSYVRTMNTRDGYAMKRAHHAGIKMAVITGGTSKGVEDRLRELGAEWIYSGVHDKKPVFEQLVAEQNWDLAEVLYIGDDIPDLPCIRMAGIGACPKDAVPEVLAASDYISSRNGGDFCVRDLIERILKKQNLWEE